MQLIFGITMISTVIGRKNYAHQIWLHKIVTVFAEGYESVAFGI